MILLKNVELYAPDYRGRQDILIAYDKIVAIGQDLAVTVPNLTVIDGAGKKAVPGFIDQHVHITGGGGENGFASRVPEIQLSECIKAGVTTLVGLLGTDSRTRSVQNLLAKTKALNEEGLTAYCLTGAYEYPSPTVTGAVADDLIYIQEMIGVKLAIADHRAPNVTEEALTALASSVRVAGMIGHKPGVVHLHTGTGQQGLQQIIHIVQQTEIPIKHFRPTHIRENTPGAETFAEMGGYLDFTSGSNPADAAAKIMYYLTRMPSEQITLSSDANGSQPVWNEEKELIGLTAAQIGTLYETTKALVKTHGMPLPQALTFTTSNVAQALALYPRKGCLAEGSDADVVLLDQALAIDWVMAKGRVMLDQGQVVVKGTFEA